MIQPVTLLGAGLCLGVLAWRYRSRPKDAPRRTPWQQLKTAKILLAAIVAWLALSYSLQHMIGKIDAEGAHEPSLMERGVSYLSK